MDPIPRTLSNAPDPRSTHALVCRAKKGDREAWTLLVERYYGLWLSRYHGKLGTEVRRIYDTEDLVQSALKDATKDIGNLRDESTFFVWVTAILRHKVALSYRDNRRQRSIEDLPQSATEPPDRQAAPPETAEFADTYLQTLDLILAAFPERPNWIAAFVMRHLDGLEVAELALRLRIPKRTAFHWVAQGTRLLRGRMSRLSPGDRPTP